MIRLSLPARAALIAAIVLKCAVVSADVEEPICKPVLKVDVRDPTGDKPQSKLWHARDSWWAWLPTKAGSSIWRRTKAGWERQSSLDRDLRGLMGRADVWAEGDMVRAAIVDGTSLVVATLNYAEEVDTYVLTGRPISLAVPRDRGNRAASIETTTIARDGNHRWWVAYPWQKQMWVRTALDVERAEWSRPIPLSAPASDDDICAVVALPGGVGVIWSDQIADSVYFRFHREQAEPEQWEPTEMVEQGNRTADDHINTAVAVDGSLFVTTKNSVDKIGQPQLVLRVRDPKGRWQNYPYANRTENGIPSRPIVALGGRPNRLFLLHSIYPVTGTARNRKNQFQCLSMPAAAPSFNEVVRTIPTPGPAINNLSVAKANFTSGQPWIALVSDSNGHVYEIRLD